MQTDANSHSPGTAQTVEILVLGPSGDPWRTALPFGASVGSVAPKAVTDPKTGKSYPVLAALVDHVCRPLDFKVFLSHVVSYIGYNHPEGRRTYRRSLCFLLQRAVRNLYPERTLLINHSLPGGLYCRFRDQRATGAELRELRAEMRRLVRQDLPFTQRRVLSADAEALFEAQGQPLKADLQRSLGRYFCTVQDLDGATDLFYGALVPSTGYLEVFDLAAYHHGFCLRYPSNEDIRHPIALQRQMKLITTLKEYGRWCRTTGIVGISSLNRKVQEGGAVDLINLCEAHQDQGYAQIAAKIGEQLKRREVRIVFIAGPSSSGKTSSSLRLALHLRLLGLRPKVIELDNYFRARADTPLDEDGNLDYEALGAMNLDLLGEQLNALLSGKAVELPRYDFHKGLPVFEGERMQLGADDILVMEGIHALNPDMVPHVDPTRIYRVYTSSLTSLKLDENCHVSTADSRLLRRLVRDNRVRSTTPESTLLRWPSVRRGEDKYIFPFQEQADAQFNSALLYELPVMKYHAEPLLRRIRPDSPAYAEACRLLSFLDYVVAMQPQEMAAIPPTSILREFIGGQCL